MFFILQSFVSFKLFFFFTSPYTGKCILIKISFRAIDYSKSRSRVSIWKRFENDAEEKYDERDLLKL